MACAATGCRSVPLQLHPLTPLDEKEIRLAASLFKRTYDLSATARFSTLELQEPPKDSVLLGDQVPRRAQAIVYDQSTNRTFEGIADVSQGRVESLRP